MSHPPSSKCLTRDLATNMTIKSLGCNWNTRTAKPQICTESGARLNRMNLTALQWDIAAACEARFQRQETQCHEVPARLRIATATYAVRSYVNHLAYTVGDLNLQYYTPWALVASRRTP